MNAASPSTLRSLCPCVLWCLVAVVAVQNYGLAAWTARGETPLYGLLYFDWDWPEATVNRIDSGSMRLLRASAWLLPLATAVLLLGRYKLPRWAAGLTLVSLGLGTSAWFLAMAVAKWWRDTAFYPEFNWGWWEVRLLEINVIIEQSVRYLAPIALLLLLPCCGLVPAGRAEWAAWLLRVAAATTFFGHGYEAFRGNPQFSELLFVASRNLLGISLDAALARQMLLVIGLQDFALALAVLGGRWRWVAAYMALWGAVTAASRMVLNGWGAFPETLIRAANAGVPLALFLYWSTADAFRRPAGSNDLGDESAVPCP